MSHKRDEVKPPVGFNRDEFRKVMSAMAPGYDSLISDAKKRSQNQPPADQGGKPQSNKGLSGLTDAEWEQYGYGDEF